MHPSRRRIHLPDGVAARATDLVAAWTGRWAFIGAHTLWFAAWFAFGLDINLLTLIVSLEAIYLSSIVLMAQNRADTKDRARDDQEAAEVETLLAINRHQLEILQAVHSVQAALDQHLRASLPGKKE